MEHRLRVLVRLDIDCTSATIVVNGCLTATSYRALLPVIRRVSSLVNGLVVFVNLRNAIHVEHAAVEALSGSVTLERDHHELGSVLLQLPETYPACGLLAALSPVRQLVSS